MLDYLACYMVLMLQLHVCTSCINRERNFAAFVLFLILAKLVWENTIGNTGTAELIGSPVLVEAHLLGVIGGVILAIGYIVGSYLFDK